MAERNPLVNTNGQTEELQPGDSLKVDVLNLGGNVVYSGTITPPILIADVNNWSPSGLENANRIDVTSSINVNITGLDASTFPDGRIIRIRNKNASGGKLVTLKAEDAASLVANRFGFTTSIGLKPGEWIEIMRDGDNLRYYRSV